MSKEAPDGTVIIEATADTNDLIRRLEAVVSSPNTDRLVVCLSSDREKVKTLTDSRYADLPVLCLSSSNVSEHLQQILGSVATAKLAFLPAGAPHSKPPFDAIQSELDIAPWILNQSASLQPSQIGDSLSISWLASKELLRKLHALEFPSAWTIFNIDLRLREGGHAAIWSAGRSVQESRSASSHDNASPIIDRDSTVLALVPHFKSDEWLASCLTALVSQSRPLDGIAVIDDASPVPPTSVVTQFPQVSLFTSDKTVGPFCLKQAIIDTTSYDAYLFQDADDWSARDRLVLLIAEAERTGAEIVGSQEVRIYCDARGTVPVSYPLDASWDWCEDPVLHPTTLVARRLLERVGGFATGLRFGGDVEFQIRASCVAKMRNVPEFCYFRRRHLDSLTMAPTTGMGSPARRELQAMLKQQSAERALVRAVGQEPSLLPNPVAERARLKQLLGPKLKAL